MEVEGIVQGFLGDSMENSQPKGEPSNAAACFDCNICLDFAADPVVTLCGHLYCWPCIYKWLRVESASLQQCPVCKAPLSENSLVPLYGHGPGTKEGSDQSLAIPSRPSVRRDYAAVASMDERPPPLHSEEYLHMQPTHLQQQQQQQQQQEVHYYDSPDDRYFPSDLSLSAGPVYQPTAGPMLGGTTAVMLQRLFRNNGAGLYYSGPNNLMVGGDSPRMRRHQMQMQNVLHQIWLFLFGFAVIFLLLSLDCGLCTIPPCRSRRRRPWALSCMAGTPPSPLSPSDAPSPSPSPSSAPPNPPSLNRPTDLPINRTIYLRK